MLNNLEYKSDSNEPLFFVVINKTGRAVLELQWVIFMEKQVLRKLMYDQLDLVVEIADTRVKKMYFVGQISGIIRIYRRYLLDQDPIQYMYHDKEQLDLLEDEYNCKLENKLLQLCDKKIIKKGCVL